MESFSALEASMVLVFHFVRAAVILAPLLAHCLQHLDFSTPDLHGSFVYLLNLRQMVDPLFALALREFSLISKAYDWHQL